MFDLNNHILCIFIENIEIKPRLYSQQQRGLQPQSRVQN